MACSDYFSRALNSDNPASALRSICALDRGTSITALSQRFGLPHHATPGGPPDRACVGAAMAAIMGARTGSAMSGPGVAAAKVHLMAHERELGMGQAAEASGITFVDDEEVAASFTADVERRVIGGIVVPWGKVARSGFAKWRFSKGSLRWADTSRIKLNLNHDHKQPIAKAIRLHNTVDGLEATFKVARGEEGDKALALAEDGVLDGFSIEVDFDDGDEWQPDPKDEQVRLVTRGRLVGVALTGFPAFDDARADRVAAARQEGAEMTEEVKMDGEPEATFETAMERLANRVTESHTKLTEELTQSVGESISAGVKVALEGITGPQAGPTTVKAARYSVTREEPVYRFDGSGESLLKDAWRCVHERGTAVGDEAADRLRKFRQQSEEIATLAGHYAVGFAPQTTSTASQIIPPGYRPDLYVPDLAHQRPIVSAASTGVLQNATPFTVPIFSSATSVTADHVEGTNPSDGSLAFGTKTVTPQAISGRLTLSREIVDSSNPAIDQIALFEMRESYARQTETKAYTLLNGANGAGGTITAGFVPSGAQAFQSAGGSPAFSLDLRKRLAAYPFSRYGSPTIALISQIATANMAAAVDTTNRPLFPSIGATNSAGLGNAVDQGWSVDGLAFVPAWAMTGAVGATDTHVFILNRSDFWVWESPLLTFRFEEKQGPANIELNVFGYFATHLLRPVGLSGIRMTAA